MARILIVGESWVTNATHFKGFDQFGTTTFESGVGPLRKALESGGHEVTWMPSHEAAERFPQYPAGLERVDVLFLSDVGANTLLLHPDTWLRGKPTPNRLALIRDWTADGGALVMCGGYYSFQGFQAGAFYHRTPVEDALPVRISPFDDRVEVPEGVSAQVCRPDHPVLSGLSGTWPVLLGYNRVEAKPEATVLASIQSDPLLVVASYGKGKSLAWTSDVGPHWCPEPFVQWEGYRKMWNQAVACLCARGE
jgi:uncharacterized membrane protein